jgi:hypothetical protein
MNNLIQGYKRSKIFGVLYWNQNYYIERVSYKKKTLVLVHWQKYWIKETVNFDDVTIILKA